MEDNDYISDYLDDNNINCAKGNYLMKPAGEKTISSSSCEENQTMSESGSNYSYCKNSTSKKRIRNNSTKEKIISALEGISVILANINERKKPKENKYKYENILGNIDWMLQQLPENRVAEVNIKIINLVNDEIEKNKI